MDIELERLRQGLELCVTKKIGTERGSSIAYSKSGKSYIGALVESDSHLLHIAPEQTALCLAVQQHDYGIERVVTMSENTKQNEAVSPIIIKILIDYARRTGTTIEYSVLNTTGEVYFKTADVRSIVPFYSPAPAILERVKANPPIEENTAHIDLSSSNLHTLLKEYAVRGLDHAFPTYDSASGYATAVATKNGKVYFSGQYSSFEKRTGIHSETAAIIAALMDKNRDITHLALVSTKYKKDPCAVCGICRQFLFEISSQFNLDIKIFCFALENDLFHKYSIDTYLPNAWSSKK
jgi:cytidine deaminase